MQLINCEVLASELKSELGFWLLLSTEQEKLQFSAETTKRALLKSTND